MFKSLKAAKMRALISGSANNIFLPAQRAAAVCTLIFLCFHSLSQLIIWMIGVVPMGLSFNLFTSRTFSPFLLNDAPLKKSQFYGVIKKVYLKVRDCRSCGRTNCALPCHSGNAVCLGHLSTAISLTRFLHHRKLHGKLSLIRCWEPKKKVCVCVRECTCVFVHTPVVVHLCMSSHGPESNGAGHNFPKRKKQTGCAAWMNPLVNDMQTF